TTRGNARDTGSPAWRLLLRLDGLREQDSGTIAIDVRTSALEPALVSFERALAKEISLEFPGPSGESGKAPGPLLVELDHPSYMPARAWVIVPDEVDSETSPPLEARVSMLPALGIVTGKVEIEDDGDEILQKVVVALFGMEPSGEPKKDPTEVARCSPDGSFRLRSPFTDTHGIVAAAPSSLEACTRPANVRIELESASPADAGFLHLGPGAVISGLAFHQDGRPPSKGEIRASMAANASRKLDEIRQIERISLVWTGEGFENQEVSAPWDGDGRFLLQGLAPGEYRLSAGALWKSLDAGIPSSWVNVPEEDLIVVAPAEEVRFELTACSQLFVVRGLGAPLARARVARQIRNGSTGTATDGQGRVIIIWSTRERQQLTFEHAGFVSKSMEIDPADITPGQTMYVDLELGPSPGRLLIRPRGIGREVLETEFLRINLSDSGAVQQSDTFWGQTEADLVSCVGAFLSPPMRLESGEILISDLRPGRYRVLIQATSPQAVPALVLAPTSTDIEIAPGATAHLDWNPTAGGRVRLNYKDASGSRVSFLELRDSAGNELDARFRSTTPPVRQGSSLHGPDLYELASPVLPGHYVLSIRPRGLPARTVSIEVRAGETTDIELDVDAP
ncbi:MAG TPA: hypothetical protein VMM35_04080, partial [Longimicrobiales bacterium]|nr:hypothetical protein [Longimicrobiales bacterium]